MIMAANPMTVQKMFAHLMPVGTEMQVTVIPSMESEETIRVRSTGGCFGVLTPGYDFPQGTLITAKVVDFQEGIPVFEPSAEWVLAKTPQKARVLFTTPYGIVVELEERAGCYVSYQKQQGLPEELKNLKEGQGVLVCGLSSAANGTYNAQTLRPAPEEEKLPEDPMANWPETKISEVMLQGSRKRCGKAVLGKILLAEITGERFARLSNGEMLELKEGYFPRSVKRAFVRVIFITQENKVFVELVKADETPQQIPQVQAAAEDMTVVGYRNEEVRRKGSAAGSLWFAGPYKLGYNYRVRIDDGVPFFEPSKENPKYPVGIVNIDIEDKCRDSFANEDEVICRINHIRRAGDDVYTFRVSILKVV